MALRLECPYCKTSYEAKYCGVPELKPKDAANITVVCVVCKQDFEVQVRPTPGFTPTWWERVVKRRVASAPGVSVQSLRRG